MISRTDPGRCRLAGPPAPGQPPVRRAARSPTTGRGREDRLREEKSAEPMSRPTMFDSPLLLGFDQMERRFSRIAKSGNDGYPPYNVEEMADGHLRITLAVAGFSEADLSVQVERNQLVIRGKQAEEGERVFLHRGIASRQFQRAFMLADGLEVEGAVLDRGLLHIDLKRPYIEDAVKTVAIRTGPDETPKTVAHAPASEPASGARGETRPAGRTLNDERALNDE
jgi:HSP20 family molecular chaperone IbpA